MRTPSRNVAHSEAGPARPQRTVADVRLEPLPDLEWSLALEHTPRLEEARSPAALRKGWIHRSPQTQVLNLFRKLGGHSNPLPAPWWLHALDRGDLESRKDAFALEDEVHAILIEHPGWAFVPWVAKGQAGYWEYGPSDRAPATTPTTVVMTDRHPGWIDVTPRHSGATPPPLPINGADGLRMRLSAIMNW